MTPLYVVLALLGFVGLLVALSYNRLVRLRNKVTEAWQDVDVQLQRRHDLIPKLTEVVKGYAAYENAIFAQLARLRSEAEQARGAAALGAPESELAGALERAIAVAEDYPRLRASDNFTSLQKEIRGTEDEIAASRYIYNDNVRIFNTRIQSFPVSAYADVLGAEPAPYFQLDSGDLDLVAAAER